MENAVTLELEGLPAEGGHVRVSDFAAQVQRLNRVLSAIDESLSGTSSLTFRVVGLSHSSPAQVVVGAFPRNPDLDVSGILASQFLETVISLNSDAPLERADADVLSAIRDLARPAGKSLSAVHILRGEKRAVLGPDTVSRIDGMLAPERQYPGKLAGMLEYLNIHGAKNLFRIYPDVGPKRVDCEFSNALTTSAVEAVGHFVMVHGTLHEREIARFPHRLVVSSIVVQPSADEAPRLIDLLGIGRGGITPPPRDEVNEYVASVL